MGDDTWLSVFPDSFHPDMSHDFDSFNVEDLHTVDNGVTGNLFPLLTDSPHANKWDFLIGHFLGVDHVGHRVGPDHPTMRAKQEQMNDVLTRVVDKLDEDTLLVVLGDHGMDRKGDHGGDGDLEVSSAMWIYSKGPALSIGDSYIPDSLKRTTTFPGATVPHRWIQQIDLVSSLSLLLGLPVPFNNLGTVIPELFWRDKKGTEYVRALELNTRQVNTYLSAYRNSSSGGELDSVWNHLQTQWSVTATSTDKLTASIAYTRLVLETCRSLWAQFNVVLMAFGLTTLVLSLLVGWGLFQHSNRTAEQWDEWIVELTRRCLIAGAAGASLAVVSYMPLQASGLLDGVSFLQMALFGISLGSGLGIVFAAPPRFQLSWSLIPLVLHPLAFLSNSFTFWEDRVVPFFLLTTLIPAFLTAFHAPTSHLRRRILFFSALFAVCVRLMGISTVCREEQHPWCSITFFAGGTVAEPPTSTLYLVLPTCILLPIIIRRILAISKSDRGVAAIFLPYILTPTLLSGTAYWLMEWMDSTEMWGPDVNLRLMRTVLSWCAMGGSLVFGGVLWAIVPVCLQIVKERLPPSHDDDLNEPPKSQVIVMGFANAFGSPYFIFWCISLGLVWFTTQLTGQLTLGLATIALLSHLEILDSVRDTKALQSAFETNPSAALELLQSQAGNSASAASLSSSPARVSFSDIVPIALLALHAFYTTGHQSTIPSIQWKSAFILSSTVTYPSSPLLVLLNTFGPIFLLALSAPLLALWNVSPLITSTPGSPSPLSAAGTVGLNAVRAGLGTMCYFAVLVTGSAVGAAALRRHLMVWKVFAPRYMAGAVEVAVVDLGVVVGVWVGVGRVVGKVGGMFGRRPGGGA